MCFDSDGDGTHLRTQHIRARKARTCGDCRGPIEPRDIYKRHVWVIEGGIEVTDQCERCQWLTARIYAEEIAEGCRPYESWPYIGSGELESLYRERTGPEEDYGSPELLAEPVPYLGTTLIDGLLRREEP